MCFLVFHVYDLNSWHPQQVSLNVAIHLKCNHKFQYNLHVPEGSTGVEREKTERTKAPDNCMTVPCWRDLNLLQWGSKSGDQWNIFKRHERVALLSHPCNNTEESSLAADSSMSAWRLFSCVLLPCALSLGMMDPKLAFNLDSGTTCVISVPPSWSGRCQRVRAKKSRRLLAPESPLPSVTCSH